MDTDWRKQVFNLLCNDMNSERADAICDTLEALQGFLMDEYGKIVSFDQGLSRDEVSNYLKTLEQNVRFKNQFRGKRQWIRSGLIRLIEIGEKNPVKKNSEEKVVSHKDENTKLPEKAFELTKPLEDENDESNSLVEHGYIELANRGYASLGDLCNELAPFGVDETGLLNYLIMEKEYLSNAFKISDKGLKAGVMYCYSDFDDKQPWPVFSEYIQLEIKSNIQRVLYWCTNKRRVRNNTKKLTSMGVVEATRSIIQIPNRDSYKDMAIDVLPLSESDKKSIKDNDISDVYELINFYNQGVLRDLGVAKSVIDKIGSLDVIIIDREVKKIRQLKVIQDKLSTLLYDILKKYPNLGLVVEQILDLPGMQKVNSDIVEYILQNSSWCDKKKNRYYFNGKKFEKVPYNYILLNDFKMYMED